MAIKENFHTNRQVLSDNTLTTILAAKPTGWLSCDVLVEFDGSADGTLTVTAIYQDANGDNDITITVESGISTSKRVEIKSPVPAVIKAQRVSSSTGDVTVAILRTQDY